jgi:hypothetical protein
VEAAAAITAAAPGQSLAALEATATAVAEMVQQKVPGLTQLDMETEEEAHLPMRLRRQEDREDPGVQA